MDIFSSAADIFDPPPPTELAATLLPHQIPPTLPDSPNYNPGLGPTGFFVWLLMAGRGAGKTHASSVYVDQRARTLPNLRIAIIAPTLGDARSACVDGPSGLLAMNPAIKVKKTPDYYLMWPNGSRADLFGAHSEDDVERLRAGGNRHLVWAEELAAWRYLEEAWDQMEFGLRLGSHPHVVASTTPKNRPKIHQIVKDPKTIITRGTTLDNPHLHQSARERLLQRYRGTTLGKQELYGELLEDISGALWSFDMIDRARWVPDINDPFSPLAPLHGPNRPLHIEDVENLPFPPSLPQVSPDPIQYLLDELDTHSVITAVDPATTSNKDSDHTGILTVAAIQNPCPIHSRRLMYRPENMPKKPNNSTCFLVLQDNTLKGSPDEWSKAAIRAYNTFRADKIVAEVNNGGDLVAMALRQRDPDISYKTVRATRGKSLRAEPIAALYEQGRVHHLGYFPKMEDQMVVWDPTIKQKASPDRLDALVWALTELSQNTRGYEGLFSVRPALVNRRTQHWTQMA